ncbi:putative signal peptide protein, partial [Puccinia sorghi]
EVLILWVWVDTITLMESVSEQKARVDQLSRDVGQMGEMMRKMMTFIENSHILNPSPQAAPQPVSNPADHPREAPPHAQAPPVPQSQAQLGPHPMYQPPMGPEFSHLLHLEPLKLPDVWFSGNSLHLASFLRTVRNFLWQLWKEKLSQ